MLVMKLVHSDDLDFVKELQELRKILKKRNITVGLVESGEGNTHLVKIMCDDEIYNEKIRNIIYIYISNIIYNIVIEQYRKKEMFDFLTDTYFFLKQEELIEVEELIMKVLKGEDKLKDNKMIYCINSINIIIEKIKQCLEENEEINIKGFITFRMKELREDIENIIDKIVEDYMVEKEYKEFIKLLKYFVEIQDSKIEEINILVKQDGSYSVYDGDGLDLFTQFIKEISECNADTEANIEDIIISGLITNAPQSVIIHGKENCNNKEFIDTILSVFSERIYFCKDCAECNLINNKLESNI